MMKTRHCTYSIVLLISFVLIGCGSPEARKVEHYKKALEYISKQEPKAATIELRNAIQIDAKYGDARYQLGLLYLKEGDSRKAYEELIRAADLDRTNLDANLKAAELYLLTGQKGESRRLVERVLAVDPHFVDGLALLANLELIEGNLERAGEVIDQAIDQEGRSERLLTIKGRIHVARQDWSEAETSFQQAIEVNPANYANYQTLLMFYENRKEIDRAKDLLKEMTEKFPENPKTYLYLAIFYRNEGNMEKVEAELQKVVAVAPQEAGYRLMLSDFYLTGNKVKIAEETLDQASSDLPESIEIKAKLATLYFDQGRFEEARKLMDTIVLKEPDNKGAKLLEARFLSNTSEFVESMNILMRLNRDFPEWSEPFYHLGLVHLKLGETEMAALAIGKAVENDKSNYKYHTVMAQIFYMEGQFENAISEAATSLNLNPNNVPAALVLSKSLLGAQEFNQALTIIQDMDRQIPENPEILGDLALAYLGLKDRDMAKQALEKLLVHNPGNNQAVSFLTALKFMDNLPGAEGFMREKIEETPGNGGLHLLLGYNLAQQRKDEEALAAFKTAIELSPDDSRPYMAAGKLLHRMGRQEEAMDSYRALVERHPESLTGHMEIASMLEAGGKIKEAMDQYREILRIKPDFSPANNNLAWLIASDPKGDFGDALRLAMMAKQVSPDEPHIADTLGWVHYRMESYRLAIPQFEVALNSKPGDPIFTYHLALALHADGQTEKAREMLEALLKEEQDFPGKNDAADLYTQVNH